MGVSVLEGGREGLLNEIFILNGNMSEWTNE